MASQDTAGTDRSDIPRGDGEPPSFDTNIAHPARVYNYWLGGKDNYEADREAGDQVIAAMPSILPTVRANRAFLRRAVEYLAGEAGIRQFLDIGTGLPVADNTHEVAQSIAPESRVVYTDNDPIVLAHARALLTSTPQGATAYIDANARDTGKILAAAAETLDFSQPVALMVLAVMQYVPDSRHPHQIIARLMDALPPGSYLAMSDSTPDLDPGRVSEFPCDPQERRIVNKVEQVTETAARIPDRPQVAVCPASSLLLARPGTEAARLRRQYSPAARGRATGRWLSAGSPHAGSRPSGTGLCRRGSIAAHCGCERMRTATSMSDRPLRLSARPVTACAQVGEGRGEVRT